jgi:hypothetical protein
MLVAKRGGPTVMARISISPPLFRDCSFAAPRKSELPMVLPIRILQLSFAQSDLSGQRCCETKIRLAVASGWSFVFEIESFCS